jgi:hypothetical protein
MYAIKLKSDNENQRCIKDHIGHNTKTWPAITCSGPDADSALCREKETQVSYIKNHIHLTGSVHFDRFALFSIFFVLMGNFLPLLNFRIKTTTFCNYFVKIWRYFEIKHQRRYILNLKSCKMAKNVSLLNRQKNLDIEIKIFLSHI